MGSRIFWTWVAGPTNAVSQLSCILLGRLLMAGHHVLKSAIIGLFLRFPFYSSTDGYSLSAVVDHHWHSSLASIAITPILSSVTILSDKVCLRDDSSGYFDSNFVTCLPPGLTFAPRWYSAFAPWVMLAHGCSIFLDKSARHYIPDAGIKDGIDLPHQTHGRISPAESRADYVQNHRPEVPVSLLT